MIFGSVGILVVISGLILDDTEFIHSQRSYFATSLVFSLIQLFLYFWAPHTKTAKDKMLWSNLFFFSFFISSSIDLIELTFTGSPDHCPQGHDTVCDYVQYGLPPSTHLTTAVMMPFIGFWAYWPVLVLFCILHWLLNISMLVVLGSFNVLVFGMALNFGVAALGIRWLIEYEQRMSFFTGWNTLKGVEQKYSYGRLILDAVGIPITVSDMEGNIEFANDSFNLIFKFSSEDFKKVEERENPNVYDVLEGFGVHNPTPDYGLEALGNGYAKDGEVIPILSSMKYLKFMGNMKMVHTIREMEMDEEMDRKKNKSGLFGYIT